MMANPTQKPTAVPLLSWSSGKDSAWSLYPLRQQKEYEIVGLLTTFNQAANRVAMHAVRRALVQAQTKSAGVMGERLKHSFPFVICV
jgi:diphthamide synthase (EF-2-diphthine--ammonia ligase)